MGMKTHGTASDRHGVFIPVGGSLVYALPLALPIHSRAAMSCSQCCCPALTQSCVCLVNVHVGVCGSRVPAQFPGSYGPASSVGPAPGRRAPSRAKAPTGKGELAGRRCLPCFGHSCHLGALGTNQSIMSQTQCGCHCQALRQLYQAAHLATDLHCYPAPARVAR